MPPARRWRPAGSSDIRWVSQRVQDALQSWFERWVSVPTNGKVTVRRGEPICAIQHGMWWCADEHACLRVADKAFLDSLALRALDLPQSIQVDQPADRELIARLRDAMMSDLLKVLSDGMAQQSHRLTFRPNAAAPPGQLSSQTIEVRCSLVSDKPWLEIWIEASWVTESLHKEPPRLGSPSLVGIQQAVLDSRVEIEVNLGRCALSARELCDLSIGDVLCIGKDLQSGVSLELRRDGDAVGQTLGSGTPGEYRGNGAISITHIYSDPRP